MGSKRGAPYRAQYTLELGLRVGERDSSTHEVLSATCQFCQLFGREAKAGALRRATNKVAVFKPPFRKDLIRQHHVGQHPRRWGEYRQLQSDDSRRAYLAAAGAAMELDQEAAAPRKTPRTSSRANAVGPWRRPVDGPPVHWLLDRDIVQVLVGTMLPYAAEQLLTGLSYQQHVVADFEDTLDSTEAASTDHASSRYRVVLDNPVEFQRFVGFLSTSGSLDRARALLDSTEAAACREDGSTISANLARYARYLCAISLQRIAGIAKSSWAYSIELKVVPIRPASLFEAQVEYCMQVKLRLFVAGEVASFHVLSVPLSKRRQSDPPESSGVFEIVQTALDTIAPQWRHALLAVVSDSDGIPTNHPQLLGQNAVIRQFERVAKPGFFRVCCAARQFDSLMQAFFTKLLSGNDFYSKLTALVAYLSRQRKLLDTMQSSIPIVGDNRWRSIANMVMWFRHHAVSIQDHVSKEQAACAPTALWWVYIMLAARMAQEAILAMGEISGLSTHAACPQHSIIRLRALLVDWFCITTRSEGHNTNATTRLSGEALVSSKDGKYESKTDDALGALMDLGTFVADTLQTSETQADRSAIIDVVNNVADCVVNLVAGLTSIVDDIDGVAELPPVLPHEVVEMHGRQFTAVIRSQTERLIGAGWSKQEIDWIEQDFQDMRGAYNRESSLKETLQRCNGKSSFQDAWNCLYGRFTHLQRFCGATATAYPTAVISSGLDAACCSGYCAYTSASGLPGDSEFGVSDLSVQAVFHAKQFRHLQASQL